jgi:hypothetical protein
MDQQDGDEPEGPDAWTADERRAYQRSLAARRARQVRAGQLFAGALALAVVSGVVLGVPDTWWVPAVGAVAALGLVFRLANWKCPRCGERLPIRRGSRCLGCGAPLD